MEIVSTPVTQITSTQPIVAREALFTFIVNQYVERSFSCSWESYSITTTEEEDLLDAALRELQNITDLTEDARHLEMTPALIIDISMKFATREHEAAKLVQFASDVTKCLVRCNMNENQQFDEDDYVDPMID